MICHTPGHAQGHSFTTKLHAYLHGSEKNCTIGSSWNGNVHDGSLSKHGLKKVVPNFNKMRCCASWHAQGHSSHINNMCICTHWGEVFGLDLCGIQMYLLPAKAWSL